MKNKTGKIRVIKEEHADTHFWRTYRLTDEEIAQTYRERTSTLFRKQERDYQTSYGLFLPYKERGHLYSLELPEPTEARGICTFYGDEASAAGDVLSEQDLSETEFYLDLFVQNENGLYDYVSVKAYPIAATDEPYVLALFFPEYICPVCGKRTIPGDSYGAAICSVCGWAELAAEDNMSENTRRRMYAYMTHYDPNFLMFDPFKGYGFLCPYCHEKLCSDYEDICGRTNKSYGLNNYLDEVEEIKS